MEVDRLASRAQSVPGLDPGRAIFRAKSPSTASWDESASPTRGSSPPIATVPVKVAERFKSPEPPLKMTFKLHRSKPSQVQTTEAASSGHENNENNGESILNGQNNGNVDPLDTNTSQMDLTDEQRTAHKTEGNVVPLTKNVVSLQGDEAKILTQNLAKTKQEAKFRAEAVKTLQGPRTAPLTKTVPAFSFKHDIIKTENKADIPRALTHFMVGNKRKGLCSQTSKEQVEKVEKGKSHEEKKKSELMETNRECTEGTTTQVLQDTEYFTHLKTSSAPIGLPQTASKVTSRHSSLLSVEGFVAPPKSAPLTSHTGVTSATSKATPCSLPACKSSGLPPLHSALSANPSQQAAGSQEEFQWSCATCLTYVCMRPWC